MSKYCSHCGKELADNIDFCPGCGNKADKGYDSANGKSTNIIIDIFIVIASILIPLFGIIYWISRGKTRPGFAAVCGILAIIAFLINFSILNTGNTGMPY